MTWTLRPKDIDVYMNETVTVETKEELASLVLQEPACWHTGVTVRSLSLTFYLIPEGAALVANLPMRVPCAFDDSAYWIAEMRPASNHKRMVQG